MKFYNKLAKRGVFADNRVEHTTLIAMTKNNSYKEFIESGEFKLSLDYYDTPLTIDVAEYEDGIVRLIAYCGKFEVGRLLVPVADFKNNLKYYSENRK